METLDELITLIREHQGIPDETAITQSALLEKDLGITGDDGVELLAAVEKKFGISWTGSDGTLREAFGLSDRQYLFHSEGFSLFGAIACFFGAGPENVKEITVGDLHLAVYQAKQKLAE